MATPTTLALDDPRRITRARDLLDRAEMLLVPASTDPADQFLGLYLAALRGAGAILALYERPSRIGSRSAWLRLPKVASDMDTWAAYFAGFSDLRADLDAGLRRSVPESVVTELRHQVNNFLDRVEAEIVRVEHGRTAARAA
ncbi:SAV_6107 family HEPN domain-containing protein [Jongsikchunia kroppenstedtii]|uniref:SAV_6107 family HEPN domain-containing protein n=1 Tax=Jongsikchunia kroppenstedtii TaxID=1121721 RepID=UPI00037EDDC9|nr:SAV_6107 family HEPN domain-containing protein [Jongsikchunia kroppenstedtii]